jgi:hypothetical protein
MKSWVRGLSCLTLAAGLALGAGCARQPGGIAASTTPINGRKYHVIGPVRSTDSHILLFGLLPIKGSNSIRAAIQAALRSKGADALIEVSVVQYSQFWLILTRNVISVEGLAIRFER